MTRNQKLLTVPLCAAIAIWAMAACPRANATAPNQPPDLGSTPPDLSQSVNPNIMVTFDDSGSMQSNFMGDNRPYDGNGWNGADPVNNPWFCAGVPDPTQTNANNVLAQAMNGVYYNPNVVYTTPLYQNGTPFPNADATLASVWADGIAVNRPYTPVTPAAAGYHNNTNSTATASDTKVTILNGALVTTITTPTCKTNGTGGTGCPNTNYGKTTACPSGVTGDPNYVGGSCTKLSGGANCTGSSCYWNYQLTVTTIKDNRWICGSATGSPTTNANPEYPTAFSDGSDPTSGGPYYYRYIGPVIAVDAFNNPTSAGITNLYTVANWQAVRLTNTSVTINGQTVNQWQNFANWYAYYRSRNLMTRSALSRVFGVLGTDLRVAYQNLGPTSNYLLPNSAIITNMANTGTCTDSTVNPQTEQINPGTPCYRSAFFNWIFGTAGSNVTPARAAMIRAGEFFTNTVSSRTANALTNPYWDPNSAHELGCRQNFSMLVTDGFWNEGNPTTPSGFFDAHSGRTLPDGAVYSTSDLQSRIYWDYPTNTAGTCGGTGSTDCYPAQADIGFYYWAHDLRSDLAPGSAPSTTKFLDAVPPFVKDMTTGVVPTATVVAGTSNLNEEVYFNPNNDPATWRHVDEFMVTLGAFGNLNFSTDTNCTANDDACDLRKGLPNSAGATGWPIAARDEPRAIDDTWHASLNARGDFFPATNPANLVQHLADILDSIAARSGQSSAESVSTSILTGGSFGYQGGYNSSGWSGYVYKQALDPNTGASNPVPIWDAGCLLTGGLCAATNTNVGTAVNPNARIIFTSAGSATALSGVPFEWTNLGGTEQGQLNLDPTTTFPNTTTTLVPTTNGTIDDNGQYRVPYLRGDRTYETQNTPSSTHPLKFRPRTSVLGAVVGSQAAYMGPPTTRIQDIYPVGTPEQVAASACASGTSTSGCNSHEKFVTTYKNRNPALFVGANDGMLHSFDAGTGAEQWAYVPHPLYANGQLDQLTNPNNGLVVSVDDSPRIQEVFTNGNWRTMLVGSMRLGGRGVYALDVTDTTTPGSEGAAAGKFLWEFSSENDSDLGYTYSSVNFARLRCNVSPCSGVAGSGAPTGGTWVVLVSGGYYPKCLPPSGASCQINSQPATDAAAGVTKTQTYLWVLNAVDGSLIKKIPTSNSYTSYGLSGPDVVDFGSDQIDDVVTAGDLAGNLWRFDLSDPNPANWKVDNMFQTYTSTTQCSLSNVHGIGCEPISVKTFTFPDPTTGGVIYVFGTGEYLGASDRTAASVFTPQHFFGVRDYGTGFASYPFHENDLSTQVISQDGMGNRTITYTPTASVNSPSRGWQIALNLLDANGNANGERDVTRVIPVAAANAAILISLIPSTIDDPCLTERFGAVMAVNAATGAPAIAQTNGSPSGGVGGLVTNPPALGNAGAIATLGGGTLIIPGVLSGTGSGNGNGPPVTITGLTPIWRRTSWNEVLNSL